MFSILSGINFAIWITFNLQCTDISNLDWSKILLFGKGLIQIFKPFPNDKILVFSKLKELAEDYFKFYENGKKVYKLVENTLGKGEIARNEQFLLFPPCFKKDLYFRHVKNRTYLGKG